MSRYWSTDEEIERAVRETSTWRLRRDAILILGAWTVGFLTALAALGVFS